MNPASPGRTGRSGKRGATLAIRESLREVRRQLAVLNRYVSAKVELKDADLDCLELISVDGPQSPSTLARRAGVHPATMTGVLDRLERGGWVTRGRDPADRRGIVVQMRRDRAPEMLRLYAGMNAAIDRICTGYSEAELEVVASFLHRIAEAGREAAADLASS